VFPILWTVWESLHLHDLRMPWLGFSDPLHLVSHHGGDATKLDRYMKMHTWIASQIAYLMQKLAATQESGSSS